MTTEHDTTEAGETLQEDRTMDTDTRHDAPLYTRTIDGMLFQLDAAGGLAFIDRRDGDAAQLVALDTRQHRALATFYTGIMRDALRERDKRTADICLAMVDKLGA
ncbi:MAG TPA: hypothetical protein VEZ12_14925 [Herpetosiphonaceae bacterium]|nr:hypothetical protein [Herpetosiphonaceae bacterium]